MKWTQRELNRSRFPRIGRDSPEIRWAVSGHPRNKATGNLIRHHFGRTPHPPP